MSYTLQFKLTQHSPLIHFQHEQEGASLRATELKPKLDRFLIAELGGVEAFKEKYAHWLVGDGKEHVALDYKVRIKAIQEEKKYIFDSYLSKGDKSKIVRAGYTPVAPSPYFADTKNIKDNTLDKAKKGVMYSSIELSIFSLKTDLLATIKRNIEAFFLLHNFGSRQSKGFGSFTLAESDIGRVKQVFKRFNQKGFFKRVSRELEVQFATITKLYQNLKSGTRDTPSALNQHYKRIKIDGENIVWEKQVIKEVLFNRDHSQPLDEELETFDNELYIRALLGLAEHHSYPQKEIPIDEVKIKYGKENDTGNEKIERFKSPLTFKIIDDFIYIIIHPIPAILYDKEFEFKVKNRPTLLIKTPPSHHPLDLEKFLDRNLEDRRWTKMT